MAMKQARTIHLPNNNMKRYTFKLTQTNLANGSLHNEVKLALELVSVGTECVHETITKTLDMAENV
jgi:hypothetical protein